MCHIDSNQGEWRLTIATILNQSTAVGDALSHILLLKLPDKPEETVS